MGEEPEKFRPIFVCRRMRLRSNRLGNVLAGVFGCLVEIGCGMMLGSLFNDWIWERRQKYKAAP